MFILLGVTKPLGFQFVGLISPWTTPLYYKNVNDEDYQDEREQKGVPFEDHAEGDLSMTARRSTSKFFLTLLINYHNRPN